MSMLMNEYFLGLDGGGTKTTATVIDANQRQIITFDAGAMNFNSEKTSVIEETFCDVFAKISEVCRLDEIQVICIGAAGVSNPDAVKFMETSVRKLGFKNKIMVTGDHQAALAGGLGRMDGMILIAGTGSICYGRNKQGQEKRTGGFGHVIDDEGSGYAIGRDMLAAVVRSDDGRQRPTVLKDLVYDFLNIHSVNELIRYIYSGEAIKRRISALAPLVMKGCEMQDSTAYAIVEQAALELTALVEPVADSLGLTQDTLVIAGSVLLNNAYIQQRLRSNVDERMPGICICEPRADASFGAAQIAFLSK